MGDRYSCERLPATMAGNGYMEWYETEVRQLESLPRPAPGATVFYGGSSIRLWETLATDFASHAVVNRGFGGATLEACLYFFERLVVPVAPGAVVLYAGDNDLGDGGTADDVVRLFVAFQQKMHGFLPGVRCSYMSIKPSPARWSLVHHIRSANERIAGLAENFIDVFHPMLASSGRPDATLFAEDGLHLSPKGYRLWRRILNERNGHVFAAPPAACDTP